MGNKTSVVSAGWSTNIRPGYYVSKNKVYYGGKELLNSDSFEFDSFKKLKYGYAKTNTKVYYKGEIMTGVDPKNFKVIKRNGTVSPELNKLNSVVAIDGNNYYQFGKLINN